MNADLHSNKREIVGSLQLKEKSKHLPPPQKKIKKITLDTKGIRNECENFKCQYFCDWAQD